MLVVIEQLRASVSELYTQMQCNNTMLQWLVGRFGGNAEQGALPEDVVIPCVSLEDIHRLEQMMPDSDIRKKVVSNVFTLKHSFQQFKKNNVRV